MDLSYLEKFNCIGSFTEAENKKTFKNVLTNIIDKALLNTTVQVNLNDLALNPKETDVSLFFYRAGTQELMYTFTHTLNRYKNPDTLILDPSIKYDLRVATLPEINQKNIEIIEHAHNTINLNAAQGFLKFISSRSSYNVKYAARVFQKDKNDNKTINHQELGARKNT